MTTRTIVIMKAIATPGADLEVLEHGPVGQHDQGVGGVDRAAAGEQEDGREVVDAEDRHEDPARCRWTGRSSAG